MGTRLGSDILIRRSTILTSTTRILSSKDVFFLRQRELRTLDLPDNVSQNRPLGGYSRVSTLERSRPSWPKFETIVSVHK
jgi:hypothetical protein